MRYLKKAHRGSIHLGVGEVPVTFIYGKGPDRKPDVIKLLSGNYGQRDGTIGRVILCDLGTLYINQFLVI